MRIGQITLLALATALILWWFGLLAPCVQVPRAVESPTVTAPTPPRREPRSTGVNPDAPPRDEQAIITGPTARAEPIARSLHVVCRSRAGSPFADHGVTVELGPDVLRADTDEGGIARFRVVSPSEVVIRALSFEPVARLIDADSEDPLVVTLVDRSTTDRKRVRVVDADDQPVSGARVWVLHHPSSQARQFAGTTGGAGEILMDATLSYLWAELDGVARAPLVMSRAEEPTCVLRLQPSHDVLVRVVDGERDGVPGARVTVACMPGSGTDMAATSRTCDESGVAVIDGVLGGWRTIRASGRSLGGPVRYGEDAFLVGAGLSECIVRLEDGATLSIALTDAAGSPIDGRAQATCRDHGFREERAVTSAGVEIPVPPGALELVARAPGRVVARQTFELASGERRPLVIRLEELLVVSGVVRVGGQPTAGLLVRLRDLPTLFDNAPLDATDDAGKFELDVARSQLGSGTLDVYTDLAGRGFPIASTTWHPDRACVVEIAPEDVTPQGTLEARFVDARGRGVPDVVLRAAGVEGPGSATSEPTTADGWATLDGLPAGTFSCAALRRGETLDLGIAEVTLGGVSHLGVVEVAWEVD